MRHVVGQLPFRSVVAKHFNLAVANLRFGPNSGRRSAIIRANHLSLDAQPRRNALDTLGKTEIRRQKVQPNVDHTLRRTRFRSACPRYTEPIKGGAVHLLDTRRVLLRSQTQIHKFQCSHLSPSLLRLDRPSRFLPESPAPGWVRSVCCFLKRDSHTRAIFDWLGDMRGGRRVDNGY